LLLRPFSGACVKRPDLSSGSSFCTERDRTLWSAAPERRGDRQTLDGILPELTKWHSKVNNCAMITELTRLGDLVKARRNLLGWTQEDLATKSGSDVNRSMVAHLEQGIRVPKPDHLKAICNCVGVPLEYWNEFAEKHSALRLTFEEHLSE